MKNYSNLQKRISYILKCITFLSAIIGTILSAAGGENAFMGLCWWILALLVFLLAVGLLYLWILNLLKKKVR